MITKDELYLVSKDWIAAMYCTWRVIFIVWFSTPIAVYGALPNQLKNNSRADATAVMQNFEYLDARTVAPSSILNVAKDGAPYSSVSDALRAINDASVDNTYLINVAAGVFTEDSTIYLKSHVYIKGVGPRATVIECACDIAIVAASIESQLSNLSLHARGTGNGPAVALRTTGTSQKFNLQNMLLTAEGGTENIGIEVMGGSTVLDTVITHPEFPPNTTGIKASNGARLIVRNADIRGSTRGAIIQGGSRLTALNTFLPSVNQVLDTSQMRCVGSYDADFSELRETCLKPGRGNEVILDFSTATSVHTFNDDYTPPSDLSDPTVRDGELYENTTRGEYTFPGKITFQHLRRSLWRGENVMFFSKGPRHVLCAEDDIAFFPSETYDIFWSGNNFFSLRSVPIEQSSDPTNINATGICLGPTDANGVYTQSQHGYQIIDSVGGDFKCASGGPIIINRPRYSESDARLPNSFATGLDVSFFLGNPDVRDYQNVTFSGSITLPAGCPN